MKTKNDPNDELRAETLELIITIYNNSIKMYTDGSVIFRKGIDGAEYFNNSNGERFYAHVYALSSKDAELLVINLALMLIQLKQMKPPKWCWIIE